MIYLFFQRTWFIRDALNVRCWETDEKLFAYILKIEKIRQYII